MLETSCEEILGTSVHSQRVRQFVRESRENANPVVLFGESGVGKETVARQIHLESNRRNHPFLMIDCSLYYERELRREMFGCHDQAASGTSRKGILEFASRGTCYLSRIEELSAGLQESLLAFLGAGRFQRVGDDQEVSSRARLIVSSEKNLTGFVEGGLFDSSLYRALAKRSLRLAPLRERAEDVAAAVLVIAGRHSHELGFAKLPHFEEGTLQALTCFPWPQNFDDLNREILRLIEIGAEVIRPEDLSFEISSYWQGQRGDPEVRKVIQELDVHIQEFRVLSQLDEEFGDVLLNVQDWQPWGLESHRRPLSD